MNRKLMASAHLVQACIAGISAVLIVAVSPVLAKLFGIAKPHMGPDAARTGGGVPGIGARGRAAL